jgi:hypothetical protein
MTPEQRRVYEKKRREQKKKGLWFRADQTLLEEHS